MMLISIKLLLVVTFVIFQNRKDYLLQLANMFHPMLLIYFIVIFGVHLLQALLMVLDFFLTIVDDFTRCTWVYLLKHKSKTQVYLSQFATMVSTQFNCKIKTIRSDNGTEFYLKDFS